MSPILFLQEYEKFLTWNYRDRANDMESNLDEELFIGNNNISL